MKRFSVIVVLPLLCQGHFKSAPFHRHYSQVYNFLDYGLPEMFQIMALPKNIDPFALDLH